jgi:hypothetical protein
VGRICYYRLSAQSTEKLSALSRMGFVPFQPSRVRQLDAYPNTGSVQGRMRGVADTILDSVGLLLIDRIPLFSATL